MTAKKKKGVSSLRPSRSLREKRIKFSHGVRNDRKE